MIGPNRNSTFDQPSTALVAASAPQSHDATLTLSHLGGALRRRIMLLLCTALAMTGAVLAATFLIPASYVSSAKILVSHVAPLNFGQSAPIPEINDLVVSDGQQSVETYVAILQSNRVAESVIRELDLKDSIDSFEQRLKITPLSNTNILQVAVTGRSPAESSATANAVALAGIQVERQLNAHRADEARDALAGAILADRGVSREAQDRKVLFETKHRIVDSDAQAKATIAEYDALGDKIRQVRADREQVEGELTSLLSQTTGHGSSGLQQANPARQELESQLSRVSVQLADARKQYTNDHPVVQNFINQQSNLKKQIAALPTTVATFQDPLRQQLDTGIASARAKIAADDFELAAVTKQQQALSGELQSLPALLKDVSTLQREDVAANSVYGALKEKYAQAVVASALATSDLSLLDVSDPAQAKRRPSLVMNVLAACFFGIVCGIVAALVVDKFRRKIDDDDVDMHLGIPLIATAIGRRNGMAVTPSLALRHFATAVAMQKNAPVRAVSLIGCFGSDDSSAAAWEIARYLGDIRGRILLVNASVSSKDEAATGAYGLVDILRGRASLDQCVRSFPDVFIDTLNLGRTDEFLLRSLSSDEFALFVDEANRQYGAVVFIAEPLMHGAAGLTVCARSDITLLTLSRSAVALETAQRAVSLLSGSGVALAGVVLTEPAPTPTAKVKERFGPAQAPAARKT